MVKIQEEEENEDVTPSSTHSPSSMEKHKHKHKHNHNNPSSSHSLSPHHQQQQQQQQQPDTPDSASSISSDHTFHGFSPLHSLQPSPSPLAGTPSPPATALVPVHVPPVANRLVRDHPPEAVTKTEPEPETGFAGEGGGGGGGGRRERGRRTQAQGVLRRARREKMVKRVGLVLRFFEVVVCLVSFSVMASDKRRGWALDSFDNYIEFRYSMSVNIIGFAYSALQGLDLLLQLTTGKDLTGSRVRFYFDFAMDQILAYLLLSASSSAFTRVDDWISNWGKDKFPAMASASVGVSFLAFVAFALSSLFSGYILCTHRFV